jgi:hypothetical protein
MPVKLIAATHSAKVHLAAMTQCLPLAQAGRHSLKIQLGILLQVARNCI